MKTVTPLFNAQEWFNWLNEAEQRTREVYRLSPERLIAEYRREREITRGYHGREVLELLQNAGDAARISKVPGKVRIVVTTHGLVIGNTGRPFDKDGVQSLQTANLSPKRKRDAVLIGDKGLGFRSILNWTHSPLISSGELGLVFLPDYASVVVQELLAENQNLASMVAEERTIAGNLIVPRLAFPQWIPEWDTHAWPNNPGLQEIVAACSTLRREGFDTAVGMPFSNQQAYQEAAKQVHELQREFLLLVDSIDKLEIQIGDNEIKVWSCNRSKKRCIIREGTQKVSSWNVSTYNDELPGELLDQEERNRNRFQIIIAVPNEEGVPIPGCLFCYFPTAVQIPLPLLVHATVELDETRKHLNDTRANRHILKVMAERIAELAELQAVRKGTDGWAGCRMVKPLRNWDRDLDQFGIPAILKAAAKLKKLIPVRNGGHRTAFEAKLAYGDSAKWWPDRLFPGMAFFEKEEHRILAQHLGVETWPTEDLVKHLLGATDLTILERAYAITGLLKSNPPPSGDNLSMLLCDEREIQLPSGVAALLQPIGDLPRLPKWANIRFLNTELRLKLCELLGLSDSRILQGKLRAFKLIEYSLSALISPVLKEASLQVRKRPKAEHKIRGEALRFLQQVYRSVGRDTTCPVDVAVKLLNQEGFWTDSTSLYLGEGYGQKGNITQALYGSWAKSKLVAKPALLGLEDTEPGLISNFMSWLGVERWPREVIVYPNDTRFTTAVKDKMILPVNFEDHRIETRKELEYVWFSEIKSVDGLAEILTNAIPEAVFAWLTSDTRAVSWSLPSPQHGKLKASPPRAHRNREYSGPIPSYTQWQIANTPWLPSTDGTKKRPGECLLADRHLEILFPRPSHPDPKLLEHYDITDRVNEAFRLSGVMPGLAQLSRDDLYRLFLEVTILSPDGKASRALCRWFVSNEGYVYGSSGLHQEKFFQQGKIWGSKDGIAGYFTVKELRHIDQEGFPNALTAKLAIADLPKRIGSQKVMDVFGIKTLERSEIRQEIISFLASTEQDNLTAWFEEAKPFIKKLRQTQTKQSQTVGAFERLKLKVCDELRVRMQYDGTTYDHTAQEGEWVLLSDLLYVRGDLDDSLDLLADTVGAAVASLFDMADGDAFTKILRCSNSSRSKLLRRMCGDDFHFELEDAKANLSPNYLGPIEVPSENEAESSKGPSSLANFDESPASNKPIEVQDSQNEQIWAVTEVSHVPLPPEETRKLIIRSLRKAANKTSRNRQSVDGEKCERMAEAFEENADPPRFALGVGHIMGSDAPGFDLASFASMEDLEAFRNQETRDWSKVLRFIEVKGRSSATAKIELKGNELRAARNYRSRYYIYRFYEATDEQFCVSILQDPMVAEEAKTTIIEVDLDRAKGTQRFEFAVEPASTDGFE
jgi:hypothetical protein